MVFIFICSCIYFYKFYFNLFFYNFLPEQRIVLHLYNKTPQAFITPILREML